MKARAFDPLRLDVEAFARAGARLDGQWPVAQLERLAPLRVGDPIPATDAVAWRADGSLQQRPASAAQPALRLRADAVLTLECQRCLWPVQVPVAVDRTILFAADESAAAALDAEIDDDVLALTRSLDLRALIEDELLLALPLVPRHARCPQELIEAHRAEPPAGDAGPFAALAALRKDSGAG